jgi:hypothetical protein
MLGDATSVIDRIPEIARIPSVDELVGTFRDLARTHPRLFRLHRIGTSRLGEPLLMLSTGTGPQHALLVGGPHPNEPVGFLTLLHLAQLFVEDAALRDGLGYTWNLIPCMDPDGARLNEGWYAGPFTVDHYHRHFYRPALRNQPEWTFPVLDESAYFDRTLSETQAMMRVIDGLRPRFQCMLHNADFGGAYFVLSRKIPGLADDLLQIVRDFDVPLELDPSEAVGWPVAGPAVFVMPPSPELFTHNGRKTGPRAHGASSAHYAQRHGTFTLITEAPMWHDIHPADSEGESYAGTMRDLAADLRREVDEMGEALRRVTPETCSSPEVFPAAVADTLAIGRTYVHRWEEAADSSDASRPITASELASTRLTAWRTPLRAAAMLRRLLRVECEAGNHRPVVRAELGATEERFARAANGVAVTLLPLRSLVALQIAAILTAIAHL